MQASALDRASHQDFQKILALLQPDGSFSDLEYEEPGSEAFVTHGRRQSALLYHHWKGKKNLTAEADLCFRYITYDAPPINEPNWWNHIIGVPVQMWQGAALAQGVLDQKLLLDFLDRYWANTLYGPVWNPKERDGSNAGIVITYYSVRALIADTGYSLLEMGRHREQVEAVLHRYENVVPAPEYALVGHRHFFNSDLSVHQRREYYASVRILSNRTVRPESWLSGENIDGYFQADGFMTILVDGGEYGEFKNEVFQVYDWARVPSVTNQYTTEIPSYQLNTWFSRYFYNDAKFSGGVTDGLVGLASMVYNRPHVPLRALKSWFFFDDVIVVVGSGITLDPAYVTHKYVGTTLTQIVFEGQFVVCTGSGKEETGEMGIFDYYKPSWLFHRNVSYVFLNGDEHLHTTAETRYHDDKELDVFMAWITHKADPINATLAYAVLPATNLEATRQFLSHPTVEVVTQNDNKHVVCHHPSVQYFGVGDGSKGVCTDPVFSLDKNDCKVLSFGISIDWTFDEAFGVYGCKVYSFDPTIGKGDHQHAPNVQFFNLGISNKTENVKIRGRFCKLDTYGNILKRLDLLDSVIDYLKMDVELAELRFFDDIFTNTPHLLLNIKQIGMETHYGDLFKQWCSPIQRKNSREKRNCYQIPKAA